MNINFFCLRGGEKSLQRLIRDAPEGVPNPDEEKIFRRPVS